MKISTIFSSQRVFATAGVRSVEAFGNSLSRNLMCRHQRFRLKSMLFVVLAAIGATTGFAQTFSDNATNYGGSWTNGSNQGTGFAAWSISTTGGNAGTFTGNPANNGMGTTGIGTTAFGMFAHGGNNVDITRNLSSSLAVGDVFSFYWAMNWDCGSAGNKGFDLRSGSTVIFNANNSNSATISYGGVASGTISSNYGTSPMLITLTRISSTQYTISITRRLTSDGTFNLTINSSAAIDNFKLYATGQQDNNGNRNIYFNDFRIQRPDRYRSAATGNWSAAATWEISTNGGTSWSAAGAPPSSTMYSNITIRSPHTVSQNQNYTSGSNNVIVVDNGGTLNMTGAGGNFQFNTLTVNGTVVRNNASHTYAGSNITVNNGGRYVHAVDGGSVPTITWNSGSTFEVTGITSATAFSSGGVQSFQNVTWNSTGQTSIFSFGGLTSVGGTFTVQSTGASPSPTSMVLLTNSTPVTATISGDLVISGGYFAPFGGNTTGSSTLNVTGNLSMTGGTFDIFRPASNTGTINLNGDFTQSAGTITKGGAGTGNFNFNRSGTQNFSKSGGTISNAINFAVVSGSTLAMGTNVLDGSTGTFTLNSGAGISTANAGGLASSGATGAIQVSGTRTFNTGANYTFNGTVPQVTGTGFTGGSTVTFSNAAGISLSGSVSASTLNLSNGVLTVGSGNTITINNGGSISATSGSLASGTAAGRFVFAGSGTITGTLAFNNVEAAGGVNFGTASTINGMFTINAGGFVNGNRPPIYATGSTLRYNVGAAYGRFDEWNASSGAGYPHHVTVTNNTILNVNNGSNAARQLAGNLTIDAGSTFSMEGMTIANPTVIGVTVLGNIVNNGTVTLASATERLRCTNYTNNTGATTTLSSNGGGDLEVTGNLIDNGTFNANTRAVFFTGAGNQDISGSGTFNIDYFVSIKSGGRIRMLNNLLCEGPNGGNAMTLSNATDTLDLNGFTLTAGRVGVASGISGSGFIRGGGNSSIILQGNGAVGTIRFDQSTDGTTNRLKDFTLNRASSGSVTIENSVQVKDVLTVTAGTLNLNNGDFTLISDASGTARVAAVGTSGSFGYLGTGRFVHQRHVPGSPAKRAWRLITVPLSNTNSVFDSWQNGGTFTAEQGMHITGPGATGPSGNGLDVSATNITSLRLWNPSTQAYFNLSNTKTANVSQGTGSSAANTGYFAFIRGDRTPSFLDFGSAGTSPTTLSARGRLQFGDQVFTNLATTSGQFTLIGNPYAAPVDMNLVFGNAGTNRVQRAFYAWDSRLAGANGVGGYVAVSEDAPGVFVADPDNTGVSEILQSGQAVFIMTDAGSGSPAIEFKESNKVSTTTQSFFRPNNTLNTIPVFRANLFLLNTADNSVQLADGASARFATTFCDCVDNQDNIKLTNTNETFGFVRGGTFLATERRANLLTTMTDTLQLRLTRSSERAYQLHLIPQALPGGLSARLIDSYTNVETPLSLTDTNRIDFVINADAASKNQDRFRVVFGPMGGPLPVTFTNITARQQNRDIEVSWDVANQINIARYEVERATDGRSFRKVADVTAVGANGSSNTYRFVDVNPTNGDHFYRVRSIDRDGQTQLTRVVKVTIGSGKTGITVYPNPVRDGVVGLQLNNLPAGVYQVRLMNMSGQQVMSQVLNHVGGSAAEQLRPASVLAKGLYQLELIATEGGSRLTTQIVVE